MADFEKVDFSGKKAIIRVDFNVPINEQFEVTDNTRIQAAMPTIQSVLQRGGSLILMSHLGRPKGTGHEPKYSLMPVAKELSKLLKTKVKFADDCIGASARKQSQELNPGEVLLLENLRFYKEETDGNFEFAKKLSELGDIYINDAFGTAHRAHASTTIIAQFYSHENRCFGLLMGSEVNSLEKALKIGERPVCAVVGGAKVSSKIEVLANLINKVDTIIVGGGMAYTFVKARGGNVGKSLVEEDRLDLALQLIKQAEARGVKMLLPIDSVNSTTFEDVKPSSFSEIDQIPADEMGLDIGPKTIELYSHALLGSKTIIWNGPMGVFEFDNYQTGTIKIGEAVADATSRGAFSLVGGGDSVAAVKKFNLENKVSYVSTGGGAMLEYLEGKVLPGIAAM